MNQKQVTPADLECQDCNIHLCRNCGDLHLKSMIFASHTVNKLKSQCILHKKRRTLFCTECIESICALCVVKHKTHEDCVKDMRTGIAEKVSNIQVKIKSMLQENEEDRERSIQLNKAIKSTKRVLREHVIKKKKELDRWHAFLDELDKHFVNSYKHSIHMIKKREKTLWSLNSSLDEVIGDDNLDVLRKVAESAGSELSCDTMELNSTIPEFRPFQSNIEQFGELVRLPNERPKDKSRFQIFVKTVTGSSFAMLTEQYEKIGDLKSKIFDNIDMPFNEVRVCIYVTGKELQRDYLTLADYGIQRYNTLILKPSSGKTDY